MAISGLSNPAATPGSLFRGATTARLENQVTPPAALNAQPGTASRNVTQEPITPTLAPGTSRVVRGPAPDLTPFIDALKSFPVPSSPEQAAQMIDAIFTNPTGAGGQRAPQGVGQPRPTGQGQFAGQSMSAPSQLRPSGPQYGPFQGGNFNPLTNSGPFNIQGPGPNQIGGNRASIGAIGGTIEPRIGEVLQNFERSAENPNRLAVAVQSILSLLQQAQQMGWISPTNNQISPIAPTNQLRF